MFSDAGRGSYGKRRITWNADFWRVSGSVGINLHLAHAVNSVRVCGCACVCVCFFFLILFFISTQLDQGRAIHRHTAPNSFALVPGVRGADVSSCLEIEIERERERERRVGGRRRKRSLGSCVAFFLPQGRVFQSVSNQSTLCSLHLGH